MHPARKGFFQSKSRGWTGNQHGTRIPSATTIVNPGYASDLFRGPGLKKNRCYLRTGKDSIGAQLIGPGAHTLLMKIQLSSGTILATLFCLLMVVSAGCIGADYVANRDVVVIRLNPDGTAAWSGIVDTGHDDSALDLIETPDGGLLIAGGRTSERIGPPSPRLIRLSPGGTILWDRVLEDGPGELTALTMTHDGDYAAVSLDGRIWRLDPDGNIRWSLSSGLEQVWSVIATADAGFVVAGEATGRIPVDTVVVYNPDGTVSSRPPAANETVVTPGCSETSLPAGPDRTVMVTQCTAPMKIVSQGAVMKLGGNGDIIWKRSFGTEGLTSAWSVFENPAGGEYLVAGFSEHPVDEVNYTTYLSAVRLDTNGNPVQVSWIDQTGYYKPPVLRTIPDGYELLYVHTSLVDGAFSNKPAVVRISRDGSVSVPEIIDAGVIITRTGDGGYFFAGFPPITRNQGYGEAVFGRADRFSLHAIKLDPDGTRTWDREIQGIPINYVKKVIQTSDGGYVILAMRENY